jgi:hypothetical protein
VARLQFEYAEVQLIKLLRPKRNEEQLNIQWLGTAGKEQQFSV